MPKLIFVEFRKLTSNRRTLQEYKFLSKRYLKLQENGFIPENVDVNLYEDLRHLIVGGWVNALSYHLLDYEMEVIFITDNVDSLLNIKNKSKDNDIFLVSIMSGNFNMAQNTISYIRREIPGSVIIVGGVHATLCPRETFDYLLPDYMVIGEADDFIRELIWCAKERKKFDHKAVWNFENHGMCELYLSDIAKHEWSWELHSQYSEAINKTIPNYVGTRSCPYSCNFCGIVKTQHRELCPNKTIEQLRDLTNRHGRLWIHFETPCFFHHHIHVSTLLSGIKQYGFKFSAQHRVENPTMENRLLYKQAADAGLNTIFLGIESAQDHVLRRINKKNFSSFIEPCLKAFADAGVAVNSGWIIGIPGQTVDDVKRDIDAAVKYIQKGLMAIALPQYLEIYPGTEFWRNAGHYGIKLNYDVSTYERIISDVSHSTNEIQENEIRSLYYEFMDAVSSCV